MTMPPPADDREPDDVPPEDADLVAYLDGEADPETARRQEAALAKNPAARTKAEALKKTFDLLDYLPKPEPSPTFTTKTLTKLDALSGSRPTTAAPTRFRFAPWLAAGVAALAFGFVLHWAVRPYLSRPTEPDLADLPIIDRLPLYAGVDDLDFARRLDDPDLFGDDADTADTPLPETVLTPVARTDRITIYRSYPAARRDQLRVLHRDLTALPLPERDRLTGVLGRYAEWLARLPEKGRKDILEAANADTRLDTIRQVRNRQWEDALPAPQREKLKLAANADERIRLIKEWRDKEHDRRLEWQLAARQWAVLSENQKPWPFSDDALAKDVDVFVRTVFKPDSPAGFTRLTPAEAAKLKTLQAATNQNAAWLPYGAYVLQLAEKYPTLPEPPQGVSVTETEHLSPSTLIELRNKGGALPKQRYRFVAGKWPEFALAVVRDVKDPRTTMGKPLGPCQPGDFAKPVNEFLTGELFPKLTPAESRRLDQLRGKWPDYPKTMIDFAKAKDLSIPGVTLPGKPSLWAKYYRYTPTRDDSPPAEKED